MESFYFENSQWKNLTSLTSRSFTCFNCHNKVAANEGYHSRNLDSLIYICPHCNAPNVWDRLYNLISIQSYGENIAKLPEDIFIVYEEARKCMSVAAYTASAMMLRKILMNFAVEKGAKEGDSFNNYVEFLCKEGYVHRANVKKAEAIKKLGNKATHKVEAISKEDAENIFSFVSLLLKYNYEAADDESGE